MGMSHKSYLRIPILLDRLGQNAPKVWKSLIIV